MEMYPDMETMRLIFDYNPEYANIYGGRKNLFYRDDSIFSIKFMILKINQCFIRFYDDAI